MNTSDGNTDLAMVLADHAPVLDDGVCKSIGSA